MGPKLEKMPLSLATEASTSTGKAASYNGLMHPRNVFRERPPDFAALAAKFPAFAACVHRNPTTGKVRVNFRDADTVRELTTAILAETFDLRVEIPPDSLVPRVPSRLNYILWLQDLLKDFPKSGRLIRGIDIGTGASLVYPLLGTRVCGWTFLATERDAQSAACARRNAVANGLDDVIRVTEVAEGSGLADVLGPDDGAEQWDFCMCNPPFFEAREASHLPTLTRTDEQRPTRPPPHSATVAKRGEVCAEGGEVGFVSRIIDDSCRLRERVRVYTSMLGRKASLAVLRAKLREAGVASIGETTFYQGRTQRWALAWTFLPDVCLNVDYAPPKSAKAAPIAVPLPPTVHLARAKLELGVIFDLLQMEAEPELDGGFVCRAGQNTWSHGRRKRRAAKGKAPDKEGPPVKRAKDEDGGSKESLQVCGVGVDITSQSEPILVFRASLEQKDCVLVRLDWICGEKAYYLNQVAQYIRNRFSSIVVADN